MILFLAATAGCQAEGVTEQQAKALIASHCAGCHIVPGVAKATGRVGPSLAGFARRQTIAGKLRNTPQSLEGFLLHPQSTLPGGAMPEMGLTGPQARAITDYLYTLDTP
ncbi:MAG: c-type cytochrome [Sphingomonadaceae bacterium]